MAHGLPNIKNGSGSRIFPKYRNWMFTMDDGTGLTFRTLLHKGHSQGVAKVDGIKTVGFIHLHKHRTEGAMKREYKDIIETIEPIPRSNFVMSKFLTLFPDYKETSRQGKLLSRKRDKALNRLPDESEQTLFLTDYYNLKQSVVYSGVNNTGPMGDNYR